MTARKKIANLLWWSVPSSDDADAKAQAGQMLDAHRAEVLAEGLSPAEKTMLRFAIDLADDAVASRGDEFTADDTAALDTLRRMAAETVVETSPLGVAATIARRTLARSGHVDKGRDHIALVGAHMDLREALLALLGTVDAHTNAHREASTP